METPSPTPPEQPPPEQPPPRPPEQPPPPATPPSAAPYPVTFSVDYPDRPLNRLTSFFRIFTVIPIAIVVAFVGSLVSIPTLLMIVFREKYPRWWYDWNIELLRFQNRVAVYGLLMDDRYPSTDDEQSVHLAFPYPNVAIELNRWLPLVKWFLAIPHYVVLVFLFIGVLVAAIIAWFAILFTGTYPRGLFDYVEGVIRWSNRVMGYAFTLITDRYPPFSLKA
jgi:hypothetical protein